MLNSVLGGPEEKPKKYSELRSVHMPELYYDVTASKSWVFGVTKVRGTLDEDGPPDRINVFRREDTRKLVGSLSLWKTQ